MFIGSTTNDININYIVKKKKKRNTIAFLGHRHGLNFILCSIFASKFMNFLEVASAISELSKWLSYYSSKHDENTQHAVLISEEATQ